MKTHANLAILFLLFTTLIAQSQNFTWVDAVETGYSLNPNMVRYTVASSPDGSIWFVGMKEQVTSYYDMMGDQFLIRYDADGNKLEEYLIEGALIINAIETDDEGNLYMGGDFYQEDVVFWDGTTLEWEDNLLHGFLAKTEPGGYLAWAMSTSDYSGPYMGISNLKFNEGTMYMAHGSWPNTKISKLDGSGALTDFIIQDGVGIASGIDLDSEGNLYVTGSCSSESALFNGVNYPSPFSYNKHLVKYNPEGLPQWVLFSEDVTCVFPKVQIDSEDYIYWSGMLHAPCMIDTISLDGPGWVFDFFVARLNPEGEVQWAREVPEGLAGDAGTGKDQFLQVLPDNSVTFAGFIRGSIDWGNGVVSNTSIPGNNILLVNFSSDGIAQWAKNTTGDSYSLAQSITADPSGNLYLTATTHDTTFFDDLQIYRESYYYPVIVKLETGLATGLPELSAEPADFEIAPNPASSHFELPFRREDLVEVRIFSMNGRLVSKQQRQKQISLQGIQPGIYSVQAILADGRTRSTKLVVTK